MNRIVPLATAALTLALALPLHGAPAGKRGTDLEGAWRLVGVRDGDEYRKPEGWEQYKLIAGGRFNWTTSKDGKILYAAGGKYKIEGDKYTEVIEFAHERDFLVGKEATFTVKIDGDKWYHKGTIKTDQGDVEIDELWERVRK